MISFLRAAEAIFVLLAVPPARVAEPERPVFVPDEILLRFRDTAPDVQRRDIFAQHSLQLIRTLLARGTTARSRASPTTAPQWCTSLHRARRS